MGSVSDVARLNSKPSVTMDTQLPQLDWFYLILASATSSQIMKFVLGTLCKTQPTAET
jgi:hypothetical protein